MKKYVIITNDRGTVVEANVYRLNDDGSFLFREEHHAVKINYTPKKKDRLHFIETVVDRKEYDNVAEYFAQLKEIENNGILFRLDRYPLD